jgi:hypothetical protein
MNLCSTWYNLFLLANSRFVMKTVGVFRGLLYTVMFFHFVVLCWVFQVTNLSIVFNDLGIECKDFRRFKKFNPSTYPRHSTLLVLYSICFCWAFFFYVIVTFLSPSLQSFPCIIIFFLTLLFW